MSPYDLFQLTTYGDILPPGQGFGQAAAPSEWVEKMAEQQLYELEND